MVFNRIGGLLALGNGLLPLRKVVKLRAEKDKQAQHLTETMSIEEAVLGEAAE